jgi:hypothetical protein
MDIKVKFRKAQGAQDRVYRTLGKPLQAVAAIDYLSTRGSFALAHMLNPQII